MPRRICWIENHICHVPLQNGKIALCDEDRFEEVKRYTWSLHKHGYPCAWVERDCIMLHRFLYPTIPKIDHINQNKIDNRSCNLRAADHRQNNANKKRQTNNNSGFKGVNFNKENQKFKAYVYLNKNQIHLGYFVSPVEVARAYDRKAIELFGEYACLNFPREGYDGTL